jgi:hypothetical protein
MDFSEKIQQLALKASNMVELPNTEEATKNALVMPFIQALGYDVFNLNEVVPEFTADVGVKKGEKVDYAIMLNNVPIILFECKAAFVNLDDTHFTQLYRYFSATEARFAILTNGIVYRFFSDLDKANVMDDRPFLEFDLFDIKEGVINELKKFAKTAFNIEEILSTATELKYTNEIKRAIGAQLKEPDDDFVKLFASRVYSGQMRANVLEQFRTITRRAFRQFIGDNLKEHLQSAEQSFYEVEEEEEPLIVTTGEETEGFMIVRAILREVVDVQRVTMRDTQSYCGILLDDTNRQPICRLHFNRAQKYLGLFDENKNEERYPIDTLEEIYQYAEHLKATVTYYQPTISDSNESA